MRDDTKYVLLVVRDLLAGGPTLDPPTANDRWTTNVKVGPLTITTSLR